MRPADIALRGWIYIHYSCAVSVHPFSPLPIKLSLRLQSYLYLPTVSAWSPTSWGLPAQPASPTWGPSVVTSEPLEFPWGTSHRYFPLLCWGFLQLPLPRALPFSLWGFISIPGWNGVGLLEPCSAGSYALSQADKPLQNGGDPLWPLHPYLGEGDESPLPPMEASSRPGSATGCSSSHFVASVPGGATGNRIGL